LDLGEDCMLGKAQPLESISPVLNSNSTLAGQLWASCLASLIFGYLIFKTRMTPSSSGCCESQK
jgi:hypothetical protein